MDAAGQRRPDLPCHPAAALGQRFPALRDPERADRPGDPSGRRGRSQAPLPLDVRPAENRTVLVLSGGDPRHPAGPRGLRLSPGPDAGEGAARLLSARDVLPESDRGGILPFADRRQRRSGLFENPDGPLSGTQDRRADPRRGGRSGLAGQARAGGAGGQLPEAREQVRPERQGACRPARPGHL